MGIGARWVRGWGFAALVLGGIVFSVGMTIPLASPVYAQAVSSIVVEGNRRVEADTIRSYFRPGPSGRIDAVQIDQALKGLYATGLFQDVRINQAGGRLIVHVIENPVINRVAFEGNKKVKDEQLSAEVQSKPRGTFSRPMVQADVSRLVDIYRRSGRFDVQVTPKIIELPNNRVDLVFEINEGAKTTVKKIVFVGNHAYRDYRLKEVIKTTESNILSFLKNSDLYDPDRVEADRDLLRRFYLKHGYADIRIVSAAAEYDPEKKGFVVTFTIDEGARYQFGTIDIRSNVAAVDPDVLRSKLRMKPGAVYNAEAVEKSVEEMSIEVAKRGYPFAVIRPSGDRNFETHVINVAFVLEEGQRAYIERINIRGNTRTRDYVIRREFDIAEGDAYNRALVDRAERRLKNLAYFKSVRITNEPGSAPDRVVLNVDVEEQSTGEFSIGGGYSTADGFLAEVSIGERNLLGKGQYARAAVQFSQRTRGFELSFLEPYFLGYRWAAGLDFFYKRTVASSSQSFDSQVLGGTLRSGFAIQEDLSLSVWYTGYQQRITLLSDYNDCILSKNAPINGGTGIRGSDPCYKNGEASLPVRMELLNGPVFVSMVGYGLTYNSLDNTKNPGSGLYIQFKQELAGVGGDVNFLRNTADARMYWEVLPDITGLVRLQGGQISGWGDHDLRMLDHFQMGPNLVRGFAPNGIGPRDLRASTQDALGGTLYWGASLELQTPLYFLPKDVGMKAIVFADAGSLWDYRGPTYFPQTGERINPADSGLIRSSVGAGILWESPFGPLRFEYGYPLTKEGYDKVQQFRFGGGTRF
jgi:outer membrane protein insertion porin family